MENVWSTGIPKQCNNTCSSRILSIFSRDSSSKQIYLPAVTEEKFHKTEKYIKKLSEIDSSSTPRQVEADCGEDDERRPRMTHIPEPIFSLFSFLCHKGVQIFDLFRRPGNIAQMKIINEQLTLGTRVDWTLHNIYTVANIGKRFLLSIPGGILGEHNERLLLATVASCCLSNGVRWRHSSPDGSVPVPLKLLHAPGIQELHSTSSLLCHTDILPPKVSGLIADFGLGKLTPIERTQLTTFMGILDTLPPAGRELCVLICGILHSMVQHAYSIGTDQQIVPSSDSKSGSATTYSAQSQCIYVLAESVSKSIAGSLMPTCSNSVEQVDCASQVLQTLVLRFGLLGSVNVSFYTDILLYKILPLSRSTDPSSSLSLTVKQFFVENSSLSVTKLRSKALSLRDMGGHLLCMTRKLDASSTEGRRSRHKNGSSLPSPTAVTPPISSFVEDATASIHDLLSDVETEKQSTNEVSKISPIPSNDYNSHTKTLAPSNSYRFRSRYAVIRRRQINAMLRRTSWFLGSDCTPGVAGGETSLYPLHSPRVVITYEPSSQIWSQNAPSGDTQHAPGVSYTSTRSLRAAEFPPSISNYSSFASSTNDLKAPSDEFRYGSSGSHKGIDSSPALDRHKFLSPFRGHLFYSKSSHSVTIPPIEISSGCQMSLSASLDLRSSSSLQRLTPPDYAALPSLPKSNNAL